MIKPAIAVTALAFALPDNVVKPSNKESPFVLKTCLKWSHAALIWEYWPTTINVAATNNKITKTINTLLKLFNILKKNLGLGIIS